MNVTFIFKTLIKVPVYTVIVYLIFNCFTFGAAYFKMLGAAHAVQMMVLEDNFLTDTNKNILTDNSTGKSQDTFLGSLVTKITPNVYLIDGQADSSSTSDLIGISNMSYGYMSNGSIQKNTIKSGATDAKGHLFVRASATYNSSDAEDRATINKVPDNQFTRTQFGTMRLCGLIWQYKFILPLIPSETNANYRASNWGNANSSNNNAVGGLANFKDKNDNKITRINENNMRSRRRDKERLGTVQIAFLFKVPGLKYYADMG
jgi:hypothetical protein